MESHDLRASTSREYIERVLQTNRDYQQAQVDKNEL